MSCFILAAVNARDRCSVPSHQHARRPPLLLAHARDGQAPVVSPCDDHGVVRRAQRPHLELPDGRLVGSEDDSIGAVSHVLCSLHPVGPCLPRHKLAVIESSDETLSVRGRLHVHHLPIVAAMIPHSQLLDPRERVHQVAAPSTFSPGEFSQREDVDRLAQTHGQQEVVVSSPQVGKACDCRSRRLIAQSRQARHHTLRARLPHIPQQLAPPHVPEHVLDVGSSRSSSSSSVPSTLER
mmetsp:Transcript_39901/g.125337  ORF Transcript_39901/g.125337 Transcript_39901/m.125337 type:complete len:238 (-) Transcript_39901:716-1429(-)